jgi:hypothetical protein
MKQYIDPQMDKLFYRSSLQTLNQTIDTYNISSTIDTSSRQLIESIREQKDDVVGDTFDHIYTNADIPAAKTALTGVCGEVIALAQDDELREEVEHSFYEVFTQLIGTHSAIEERVKENLGASMVLDQYITTIQTLQTKITNGTATIDDVRELERVIDHFFQFKADIQL